MNDCQLPQIEEIDDLRCGCTVCGGVPSRWTMPLDEPDRRGRWKAYFCERHEANKDMLVAQLLQRDESLDLVA
jgi:hypothetical protein